MLLDEDNSWGSQFLAAFIGALAIGLAGEVIVLARKKFGHDEEQQEEQGQTVLVFGQSPEEAETEVEECEEATHSGWELGVFIRKR